jgi:hypothetical protein
MDREPVPSAIVTRLLEAAKELEQWAVEHRQANLTEHEQGVHVVQVRMKRSGMRWSDAGGQALLALCAYRASNRPLLLPGSVPLAA